MATTFVSAVQASDNDLQHACQSSRHAPSSRRIDLVRNFGTLLIADARDVSRPGDVDLTIDVPGPPIPNIATGGGTTEVMPAHICGLLVTVADGGASGYSVTDVSAYCSD